MSLGSRSGGMKAHISSPVPRSKEWFLPLTVVVAGVEGVQHAVVRADQQELGPVLVVREVRRCTRPRPPGSKRGSYSEGTHWFTTPRSQR
jgi:hypothetical protein